MNTTFELTEEQRNNIELYKNPSIHRHSEIHSGLPQKLGFYNFVNFGNGRIYLCDILTMNHEDLLYECLRNVKDINVDVRSVKSNMFGIVELSQIQGSTRILVKYLIESTCFNVDASKFDDAHYKKFSFFQMLNVHPSQMIHFQNFGFSQERLIIPEYIRELIEVSENFRRVQKEHERRIEEARRNFVREAIDYRNCMNAEFLTNNTSIQNKFEEFKESLRAQIKRVSEVEEINVRAQMKLAEEEEQRRQETIRRGLEQERARLQEIERKKIESIERLRQQEFINYERICQLTEMSDSDLFEQFSATSMVDLIKIRNDFFAERERLEKKYVSFASMRFDQGEHNPIETPDDQRHH